MHAYLCLDIMALTSLQSKVAQTISATVPPDYASSLNVVYFPQLGNHTDTEGDINVRVTLWQDS